MNKNIIVVVIIAIVAIIALNMGGGDNKKDETQGQLEANTKLKGSFKIDGSSTVYPISAAAVEVFRAVAPNVKITVSKSGTGGGFKKFYNGETHINDASRPIKAKEQTKIDENKINYIELPVAYDGLSVVVNKENPIFAKGEHITTAELNKIWDTGSKVKYWSEVREGWPKEEIKLFGPGHASGTFDYFTETINGKSGQCRTDFSANEEDNVLVRGVSGNKYALGYFGFSYYTNNKDKLHALPIKYKESAAVAPSMETIENGTYAPLSRPIFIYVNADLVKSDEAFKTFVLFYLDKAPEMAKRTGYVPLPKEVYELAKKRVNEGITGSIYAKGEKKPLLELMKQ